MRVEHPVILIGVCSCRGTLKRREGIRASWGRDLPSGITCRFIVGENPKSKMPIEGADVVCVPAPDHYGALPQKMMAWYRHSVMYYSYDWLFKCDDDTYIAVDRLRALCNTAFDMIGNLWIYWRGSPSGGAGYMMSRKLVEQMVDNEKKMMDWPQEDLVFGKLAQTVGAKMLGDGRLGYGNNMPPTIQNDQITAHWCGPQQMQQIYDNYHGEKCDDQAGEPGSEAVGEGSSNDEASDGAAAQT